MFVEGADDNCRPKIAHLSGGARGVLGAKCRLSMGVLLGRSEMHLLCVVTRSGNALLRRTIGHNRRRDMRGRNIHSPLTTSMRTGNRRRNRDVSRAPMLPVRDPMRDLAGWWILWMMSCPASGRRRFVQGLTQHGMLSDISPVSPVCSMRWLVVLWEP